MMYNNNKSTVAMIHKESKASSSYFILFYVDHFLHLTKKSNL